MKTRDQLTLLGGVGLGAGLMYLLDPDGGRRRRAVARDKTVHGLKVSGKAVRKTSADMGNRTKGLVAKAGSHLRKASSDDDQILSARVRSKLGRCLSRPSAVQVEVEDGRIILSGQVSPSEFDTLLSRVQKVKGVHEVESRLEVQESPDPVPDHVSTGGNTGRRLSLGGLKPRHAAMGAGALAGTVGLGLLAKGFSGRSVAELTRPLRDSRWVQGGTAGRLEW